MTLAWYQLFGRLMVTNPFNSWDGCYTYPSVYANNGTLIRLPEFSPPSFVTKTPLFFSVVFFPVVIIIILVAIIGSYFKLKRKSQVNKVKMISPLNNKDREKI